MFGMDFIIDLIGTEMCKYKDVSVVYQVIPHVPNEVKLSLRNRWFFIASLHFRVIREDHLVQLVCDDPRDWDRWGYSEWPIPILTYDIRDPSFNIPQFAETVNDRLRRLDWVRVVSFLATTFLIAAVGYLHFRY